MNNGLYSSQGNSTSTDATICRVLFAETTGEYYGTGINKTVLNTTVYETNNITRSGDSIIVNSAGYYNIYAQVYTYGDRGANHMCSLAVYVNGIVKSVTPQMRPTAENKLTSISTTLQLNIGDVIEFYTYVGTTSYDVLATEGTFNARASYADVYKIK